MTGNPVGGGEEGDPANRHRGGWATISVATFRGACMCGCQVCPYIMSSCSDERWTSPQLALVYWTNVHVGDGDPHRVDAQEGT